LHPPCWAGCKTPIFFWAYGPMGLRSLKKIGVGL